MRPIFIGGCDRSGTTLLAAMLGGHPLHVAVPEMPFKVGILEASGFEERTAFAYDFRYRIWALDGSSATPRGDSPRVVIEDLVRAYAEKTRKKGPQVWIDHTPSNLRHLPILAGAFPDARFIHLVRDGRAVAASLLRVDWGPNDIARAARFWVEQMAHALAAEASRVAPVTRVYYEDLVEQPEATVRKLCVALGVEYLDRMLEAQGFSVPEYATATHRLIGRAPALHRVAAWREELAPRQVEIFESIAGDLLTANGYKCEFGKAAIPPSTVERLRGTTRHLVRARINKQRSARRRRDALQVSVRAQEG
jgi:hypothetical protein